MKTYKVTEKQLDKLKGIQGALTTVPILYRELGYLVEDIENQPLEDSAHAR